MLNCRCCGLIFEWSMFMDLKEFYFNKSNESKIVEQPKVKELEKRSSQIDKFNKRYGL